MSQPSINPYGAVDLSGLARPAPQPGDGAASGGGSAAPGGVVVDVTEADFQALVDQSMSVPVVIDFWADWCGPCKQLSPVLERLAVADGGRWLLAKIDLDANPRLGQAFQVQSIPAVFAVVKGQPVPLFQGAIPEAQVRQYIDELLRVAEANGVTGRLATDEPMGGAEEEAEPAGDPRYDAAYDAIERGRLERLLGDVDDVRAAGGGRGARRGVAERRQVEGTRAREAHASQSMEALSAAHHLAVDG